MKRSKFHYYPLLQMDFFMSCGDICYIGCCHWSIDSEEVRVITLDYFPLKSYHLIAVFIFPVSITVFFCLILNVLFLRRYRAVGSIGKGNEKESSRCIFARLQSSSSRKKRRIVLMRVGSSLIIWD